MFGLTWSSTLRKEQERALKLENELRDVQQQLDEERFRAQSRDHVSGLLSKERRNTVIGAALAVVAVAALGGVAVVQLRTQLAVRLSEAVARSAAASKETHLLKTQIEDLRRFGHQKFATAMLGTGDDLQRALEHIPQQALEQDQELKNLHDGIDMISVGFEKRLNDFDIFRVSPKGELFDPNFHEAVQRVEDPTMPYNHVAQVMQDGYKLHGRCIRPARVVVNTSSEYSPSDVDNEA